MNENERSYFLELTLHRKLKYIEDTWGVRVTTALDMVQQPRGRTVLVGTASVLDALHAAELNHPPAVVLTTRLLPLTNVDRFLGELLVCWVKSVKEHNDALSA